MISIVIPAYNEAATIGQSLKHLKDALEAKRDIPYEIIVSDDCSTDETVSIASQYADIVLTTPTKHRSIAANRNAGAKVAKGEILVFMDAKSFIQEPEQALKIGLSRFANDPKLMALTGKIHVFPKLRTFGDKIVYPIFNLVHRIKNNYLHMGEAAGIFQMIRREAFDKVGGYREDLITREDADIFQRLGKLGRTSYEPRILVLHDGRRAHRLGWPKLLTLWMLNTFTVALFNKSYSKDWILPNKNDNK